MGNIINFSPVPHPVKFQDRYQVKYKFQDFLHMIEERTNCQDRQKRVQTLRRLDECIFQNPDVSDSPARRCQEVVEAFVDDVLVKLQLLSPRWKLKVIKSGSFYDGLRVALPYEFDFMLEIQNINLSEVEKLKDGLTYRLFTDDASGCLKNIDAAEIYAKEHQQDILLNLEKAKMVCSDNQSSDNGHNELESFGFRYSFYSDLNEALREIESSECLRILHVRYVKDTNPNFCVWLEVDGHGVMIDLVPCFKFPLKSAEILPTLNHQSVEVLQKLTGCREDIIDYVNSSMYLVCTPNHWRLSYSLLEQRILQRLPSDSKISLRILKYFCNVLLLEEKSAAIQTLMAGDEDTAGGLSKFGYKTFIKSYSLKCGFLEMVKQSLDDTTSDSLDFTDPWKALVFMLYQLSFHHNKCNQENYLVLQSPGSFFGMFSFCFTILSEKKCYEILSEIGNMLNTLEENEDFDKLPMLNYPKHHGAVFMPEYL